MCIISSWAEKEELHVFSSMRGSLASFPLDLLQTSASASQIGCLLRLGFLSQYNFAPSQWKNRWRIDCINFVAVYGWTKFEESGEP